MIKKYFYTAFLLLSTPLIFAQCIASFTGGGFVTAVRRTDGSLMTCGNNDYGQLGHPATLYPAQPLLVVVNNDTDWSEQYDCKAHFLAIKTNGTLWAWGRNVDGELGNGQTTNQFTPVQIGTDTDWVAVKAGFDFSLVLKSNGTLWACGKNDKGQLGNGTYTNSSVLQQIGTDSDWATIEATSNSVMAIKTNGTLWAWGDNYFGNLGIGVLGNNGSPLIGVNTPQQVGTDTDWKKISCTSACTMGLKNNNTLWVWGTNQKGILGLGIDPQVTQLVPVQLNTDTDWATISICTQALAVKNNGTLWVWGSNIFGALGNGTTAAYLNSPTQLGTSNNWLSARAVGASSLALNSNGELYGWGDNQSSQLAYYYFLLWEQHTPMLMSVSCLGLENNTFTISQNSVAYPNPTSNWVTLKLPNAYSDVCSYTISNSLGQIIEKSKEIKLHDDKTIVLDLSNYPTGMYLINIKNSDKEQIIKVMKK